MHSHIMVFIAVSMSICFDALKREQAKTITHEEYIQSIHTNTRPCCIKLLIPSSFLHEFIALKSNGICQLCFFVYS